MYGIWEKERKVKGVNITTYNREIVGANILEVEAGTNGPQGGDSGHGCRTYFRISDLSSTDIDVNVLGEDYLNKGVEISLGGDFELKTFIETLKFTIKTLENMSKGD